MLSRRGNEKRGQFISPYSTTVEAHTIYSLLQTATARLAQAGVPEARLNAEWLLAHCLNCRRSDLIINAGDVATVVAQRNFNMLLERRERREPLQYLLGTQDFFGRTFQVSPVALIPRPETEELVDTALKSFGQEPEQVIDIGTGSGCIAITLALAWSSSKITAVDTSVDALRLACKNADLYDVRHRIRWLVADLFPEPQSIRYNLIVGNPPYCAESERDEMQPEVRDFEPHNALFGGADGLAIIRRIIAKAPARIAHGGTLLLEIGAQQAEAVSALLTASGAFTDVAILNDLSGRPRIAQARA